MTPALPARSAHRQRTALVRRPGQSNLSHHTMRPRAQQRGNCLGPCQSDAIESLRRNDLLMRQRFQHQHLAMTACALVPWKAKPLMPVMAPWSLLAAWPGAQPGWRAMHSLGCTPGCVPGRGDNALRMCGLSIARCRISGCVAHAILRDSTSCCRLWLPSIGLTGCMRRTKSCGCVSCTPCCRAH